MAHSGTIIEAEAFIHQSLKRDLLIYLLYTRLCKLKIAKIGF